MYKRVTVLVMLSALLWSAARSNRPLAQEGPVVRGGCAALDKSKPPLFISFESPVEKAWAGDKYERGVLLRLNNNSDCAISLTAQEGSAPGPPLRLAVKDGRIVRAPDVGFGSLYKGQRVSLYYLTKYPNKKFMVAGGFGGDVLETVYLNGGDHVFFGVPLRDFEREGEVLLPYNYDWDEGDASRLVTKEGGRKQRHETVKHYLRFVPRQLPADVLR